MSRLEQLAKEVGERLQEKKWKLATAESCTAGGVAYWVTSIPGSSAWFDRGFVTYSNASKEQLLGVHSITLSVFGSVSEQIAREMAEGALAHSQAQVSIALTGIAGPDGGSPDKPIGTLWIACASAEFPTQAYVDLFRGDRLKVREQFILTALHRLLEYISFGKN